MSCSGAGKFCPLTASSNPDRPKWWFPQAIQEDPIKQGKLLLKNTLTGKKDVFVPSQDRTVRWYTCGPTVYDSSHVGHARTYLSLDIMRRIMTDYFRYNVLYQINTTDIDDKIILRARQNVLVQELLDDKEGAYGWDALVDLVQQALERSTNKMAQKKEQMEQTLADAVQANDSRARTETEGLLEQHAKKTSNLEEDAQKIHDVIQAEKGSGKDRNKLVEAARSVLAEWLDGQRGHTVTDHAVFDAHARKYEREFMQDLAKLGIRPPDVLTRVTEYVPQIIQFIQRIVDKGLAYVGASGSVYLNLEEFQNRKHEYRKLSPAPKNTTTSAAEQAEGEGALSNVAAAEQEKRHENDFVLWKASKRINGVVGGEPAWESPWGLGRPGWHIECSVVATDILGERLDIHSGGEDLKFPHHDNELAQSEACLDNCQQWVNYFTHTGHLHIEGLKMSKSLKNFITIRQALEHTTARQMRLIFLLQAWDEPMNYSDQTVEEARAKENTFRNFFREVEALMREDYLAEPVGWRMGNNDPKAGASSCATCASDRALSESFLDCQLTVHEKLLDNFNTKDATLALLSLISDANTYLRGSNETNRPSVLLLRSIAAYITQILKVFGVVTGQDDFGLGSGIGTDAAAEEGDDGGGVSSEAAAEPYIQTLVDFRAQVRDAALAAVKASGGDGDAAKDAALKAILQTCDALRDEVLPTVGVRLEDRSTGTRWNREDPAVMKAEMESKKARELEERQAKLEKKLVAKEKELAKFEMSLIRPQDLFRPPHTDEFKEWDEQGVPTTTASGEALSKGQIKKKQKAFDKQKKVHDELMAKTDNQPERLLQETREQVEAIRQQLAEIEL